MNVAAPRAVVTSSPGMSLHDLDPARHTIPRALHGLAVHSPWRYLRRAAQVGFELASAGLLDRLAPTRGGVTEVTPGHCLPRGTSLALYLHWSPSGCISAMVRRQLAIWRECGFDVVFISNADPPPDDWQAVGEHTVLRVRRRNTGRDFGAWRDCTAPGFLDTRLHYAARLRLVSRRAARASSGLR